MAAPPGYSGDSILPQPTTPVELKVFQGGGMGLEGGGAADSLLPQPSEPVEMKVFQGGGDIDKEKFDAFKSPRLTLKFDGMTPDAINKIVGGISIIDSQGRVLVYKRAGEPLFTTPGGGYEDKNSKNVLNTAKRETTEEIGWDFEGVPDTSFKLYYKSGTNKCIYLYLVDDATKGKQTLVPQTGEVEKDGCKDIENLITQRKTDLGLTTTTPIKPIEFVDTKTFAWIHPEDLVYALDQLFLQSIPSTIPNYPENFSLQKNSILLLTELGEKKYSGKGKPGNDLYPEAKGSTAAKQPEIEKLKGKSATKKPAGTAAASPPPPRDPAAAGKAGAPKATGKAAGASAPPPRDPAGTAAPGKAAAAPGKAAAPAASPKGLSFRGIPFDTLKKLPIASQFLQLEKTDKKDSVGVQEGPIVKLLFFSPKEKEFIFPDWKREEYTIIQFWKFGEDGSPIQPWADLGKLKVGESILIGYSSLVIDDTPLGDTKVTFIKGKEIAPEPDAEPDAEQETPAAQATVVYQGDQPDKIPQKDVPDGVSLLDPPIEDTTHPTRPFGNQYLARIVSEDIKDDIMALKLTEDEQEIFKHGAKLYQPYTIQYIEENPEKFYEFWKTYINNQALFDIELMTMADSKKIDRFYRELLDSYRKDLSRHAWQLLVDHEDPEETQDWLYQKESKTPLFGRLDLLKPGTAPPGADTAAPAASTAAPAPTKPPDGKCPFKVGDILKFPISGITEGTTSVYYKYGVLKISDDCSNFDLYIFNIPVSAKTKEISPAQMKEFQGLLANPAANENVKQYSYDSLVNQYQAQKESEVTKEEPAAAAAPAAAPPARPAERASAKNAKKKFARGKGVNNPNNDDENDEGESRALVDDEDYELYDEMQEIKNMFESEKEKVPSKLNENQAMTTILYHTLNYILNNWGSDMEMPYEWLERNETNKSHIKFTQVTSLKPLSPKNWLKFDFTNEKDDTGFNPFTNYIFHAARVDLQSLQKVPSEINDLEDVLQVWKNVMRAYFKDKPGQDRMEKAIEGKIQGARNQLGLPAPAKGGGVRRYSHTRKQRKSKPVSQTEAKPEPTTSLVSSSRFQGRTSRKVRSK